MGLYVTHWPWKNTQLSHWCFLSTVRHWIPLEYPQTLGSCSFQVHVWTRTPLWRPSAVPSSSAHSPVRTTNLMSMFLVFKKAPYEKKQKVLYYFAHFFSPFLFAFLDHWSMSSKYFICWLKDDSENNMKLNLKYFKMRLWFPNTIYT